MRCSSINRYLGGIILMSAMGTALLLSAHAADPPIPKSPADATLADPFPIRRLLLSGDRLAKELERVKQGVLVQLPVAEFEERVRAAAKAQKVAREEPRLLEMHYRAQLLNTSLEDNGLTGTAEWKIHPEEAVQPFCRWMVCNLRFSVRAGRTIELAFFPDWMCKTPIGSVFFSNNPAIVAWYSTGLLAAFQRRLNCASISQHLPVRKHLSTSNYRATGCPFSLKAKRY